MSTKCWD